MQKFKMQNEGLNEHEVEKPVEEITERENGTEREERKEVMLTINTMKDFLEALYWSYEEADNVDKPLIGHQIVKINQSLSSAGLSPDKVYIEETPEGVLGMFDTQAKKIIMDKDLLEDFNASQSLIIRVLFHEKMHAKGYADEGMTEIVVDKQIPAAIKFYVTERNRTERTFHALGMDKAIGLYDLKHPEKLIDEYLAVELKKNFPIDRKERRKLAERKVYFDIKLTNAVRHYEEKLTKAIPRLEQKLPAGHIREKIRKTWQELLK
jgi:hypothetical protein